MLWDTTTKGRYTDRPARFTLNYRNASWCLEYTATSSKLAAQLHIQPDTITGKVVFRQCSLLLSSTET